MGVLILPCPAGPQVENALVGVAAVSQVAQPVVDVVAVVVVVV